MKTYLSFSLALLFVATAVRAEVTTYQYDAAGRLVDVVYTGRKQISYSYDRAGNITNRTAVIPTSFAPTASKTGSASLVTAQFGAEARADGFPALDRATAQAAASGSNNAVTTLIKPEGNQVTIYWQAVVGKKYRVQYKDDLGADGWAELPDDIVAESVTASFKDTPQKAGRFYRVILLP